MVQLSATRCNCIAILWVSLVRFAAITLCVASQRAIPEVSVYFVIDSVWKILDTPSYSTMACYETRSWGLSVYAIVMSWNFSTVKCWYPHVQSTAWRITYCRLYQTTYSVYSQLHSIYLEIVISICNVRKRHAGAVISGNKVKFCIVSFEYKCRKGES
jgi:hypothetical protein